MDIILLVNVTDTLNSSISSKRSDRENPRERILKLVIIGKPSVGKTSLRRSFMGDKFRQNYLPTLGADFSLHIMEFDEQRVKTTLWDLSGQTRFFKVHPQYYVGSHGAIVLYDKDSDNPEEELISWIDTYLEHAGRFTGPVLIIQNKIDLISSQVEGKMSMQHERLIRNIQIYYKDRLSIYSGRTSAMTGENVEHVLEHFIQEVTDYVAERPQAPSDGNSENIGDYAEAAYLITFENMIGPVIITKSPYSPHMDYSPEEEASAVNVSAGINLEELAEIKYDTGTAMWTDPVSIFYYIAFVIENENARGNYDLYIIGVNLSRDLKNLIGDEQHIIQGHLISKMNRFSDFLGSNNYILSDEEELIRLSQSKNDHAMLLRILTDLRQEIDSIVRDKLN